ncbi:Flagellar biosynthetic protein FlhB OS=Ureibacillus acetophenoni OX=614649 GN=flhB PE=3 SV=1 [Ureibacillus acetophenoni]
MKLLLPLDIQYFSGEKTEKATPKKRQDARKKGQVVKSQDVTAAFLLLSLFLLLYFWAPSMLEGLFSFLASIHRKKYAD